MQVFRCFSRVYNSKLRTINYAKVMKFYRTDYFFNNSCSFSSQDAKISEKLGEKVNFTFVRPNGEKVNVTGLVGDTILTVAMQNDLDVEGACEGSLACTTCHCYLDEKTETLVEKASEKEEDLLDTAPFLRPNSRLGCQIYVTKEMEGVTFALPKGTVNYHVDKS